MRNMGRALAIVGAVVGWAEAASAQSADTGIAYTAPLKLDATTTLVAVAFKEGLAPSPAAWTTTSTSGGRTWLSARSPVTNWVMPGPTGWGRRTPPNTVWA